MKRVFLVVPFLDPTARRRLAEAVLRGHMPEASVNLALLALEDSIARGEAPYAWPIEAQALVRRPGWDEMRDLRAARFRAVQHLRVSELAACYCDQDIDEGMAILLDQAQVFGVPVEYRHADGRPAPPPHWLHERKVPHPRVGCVLCPQGV